MMKRQNSIISVVIKRLLISLPIIIVVCAAAIYIYEMQPKKNTLPVDFSFQEEKRVVVFTAKEDAYFFETEAYGLYYDPIDVYDGNGDLLVDNLTSGEEMISEIVVPLTSGERFWEVHTMVQTEKGNCEIWGSIQYEAEKEVLTIKVSDRMYAVYFEEFACSLS